MFHVKRFGTIDAKILASHLSGAPLGLVRPAKADVFLRLFWGSGWAGCLEPITATISNLPDLLKVLSAVQTILGTILLFLVGLGIRNRFRMR
jgi:hypothetical protein